VPEAADLQQHRVARAVVRAAEQQRDAEHRIDALEVLAVLAGRHADALQVAVDHPVQPVVERDVRRLQPALGLAERRIRLHRDPHRLPVLVGQLPALPAMEQPREAAHLGPAHARPQLPRPVRSLPDGEVHRLLLVALQRTELRIAGDAPPVTVDLGHQGLTRGLGLGLGPGADDQRSDRKTRKQGTAHGEQMVVIGDCRDPCPPIVEDASCCILTGCRGSLS